MSFLGLATLNVAVFAWRQGFGVTDLLVPENALAIATRATADRYELGVTAGNPILVASSFVNAFLWGAAADAPFLFALVAGVMPCAVYSALSTEKLPFYCALSFFLAGVLLSRAAGRRSFGAARIALAVALAVPVGMISLVMRQGISEAGAAWDAMGDLAYMLSHYLFAQYDAFGQWLETGYAECCTLGLRTFSGPASLLGLTERQQGVFEEQVVVRGLETNIYTAWRFVAEDFSVGGPIVLVTAYAIVYRYCLLSGRFRAATALFSILLISTFLQIATTIFAYNSVAIAAVVCSLGSGFLYYRSYEST
jgi:oligosaccharide repeat unit polymerase